MAVVATISKGYDLDYMWKNASASPTAEYYIGAAEAGEPPGRWWGPGAQALGLAVGEVVERGPYDLLFGERKSPAGTHLGRPLRRGEARHRYEEVRDLLVAAEPHATSERLAQLRIEAAQRARISPLYMDLTFSFSKSISVFHASLAENGRLATLAGDTDGERYWVGLADEMEDMIWRAVHAGFEYFQREAGYTRTGSHHRRADGRETGQWREAELVVAHWLQHTSRDGDMQLHVHSQIAHICRTVLDGKWRAPDSLGYQEHVAATGSLVAQHLEEAMTRRFGVEWVPRADARGFEIAGIGADLMGVFSSRRADIDAATVKLAAQFEARYGRQPSQRELGDLREQANLRTRVGKQDGAIDWNALRKDWAARLASTLGISLASVAPSVSDLGRQTKSREDTRNASTPVDARKAAQMALALAHQESSTFTRADLVKHLGRVLTRTGADPAEALRLVEELADRALSCEFGDVACLAAPEVVRVPPHLLRSDGRSVFQRHGGTRYATQVQLSMEQRLVAQAGGMGAPCLSREESARLLGADAAQLDAALRGHAPAARDDNGARVTQIGLRLDQAAAAHVALTSSTRVTVVNAPAGSGKTRVLAEIGRAWATAGAGRVIGITPSQAARNTLARGVAESYNMAQFLGHLPGIRGARSCVAIGPGDLVLGDEASMMSTPDLADVVAYVTDRGAKLVLAGDLQQLQAVGNGGAMSLLAARLGSVQLTEAVRFAASWEREASLRLREGDVTVLADYDAHGRILGGPPEQITEHAAHRYVALTLAGLDVLLMASDHAHRRELCRRIRSELIYLGQVMTGPAVTIADGQQASIGDLIVCTRNDHSTQAGQPGRTLANGDLLRIDAINGRIVTVRRALDADPDSGARRWSDPFVYPGYDEAELGYAVTDHAAQSRTVHTGLQLITGSESRQQAYVGLSRGTATNIALVFTTTPGRADPEPGQRPAPELARAQQVALDRRGRESASPGSFDAAEALSVLAGVLARDDADLSATQTQEQSFAAADDLAVLYAQWQAVTYPARTARWRELLLGTVPEQYRAEPGHQARWLWRTLHAAELAGLDPDQVLTSAINQRDLTGARDVAAVIDARIRQRIAGMGPLPQPPWSQRSPEVGPEHQQYAADLAVAMDERTQRIGEFAAEHQPQWATGALGPVPTDPLDRLGWQHKAAVIGAYRELAGHRHPSDPIGPEPVTDPDLRAAWHDASARLGSVKGADVRSLDDGTLHLLRDSYQIQTNCAPRYVTAAVRQIRIAAEEAELQAIRRDALARSSHRDGQPSDAQANERLAASYRAMADIYRSQQMILTAADADRREWDVLTEQPRRLAIAADSELRRRHPEQRLEPLRSAEPEPVTKTELAELVLTPGGKQSAQNASKPGWIADLAAQHATFAAKLADSRRSAAAPGYENLGQLLQPFRDPWPNAILQPPKPVIKRPQLAIGHGHQRDYEPEASR